MFLIIYLLTPLISNCCISVYSSYVEKEETKRKELGIDLKDVPLDMKDNQELADKGINPHPAEPAYTLQSM